MQKIKLATTELMVSPLCLGTVNYGSDMSVKDSLHQLSHYVQLGGNFIDTARIYGIWAGKGEALSERIIGQWIKETGLRDKIVLATKGAHPDWDQMDTMRVQPHMITEDLDKSLKHLCMDVIDLYFLHRDDPAVPVIDILLELEKAVKQGKIKHYGCSNWTLARILEAERVAKEEGLTGFVCNQLMWSLADVHFDGLTDKTFVLMDDEMYANHTRTGMGAMAYMSIAKGYFMRRAAGENLPQSVRAVYDTAENERIYHTMTINNADPLTASLTYLTNHPFASVAIASFDSDQQLEDAMGCYENKYDAKLMDALAKEKRFIV
ncbi:MAG: aldo/keto reductase [Clostridiales bacterium]|nr:aldo/keto reductase [Clostridiales bacterium]